MEAEEKRLTSDNDTKNPHGVTLEEVGLGGFLGVMGTSFIWPQVSKHLQNHWQSASDYFYQKGLDEANSAYIYEKIQPDNLMKSIAEQNKESWIEAGKYSQKHRDELFFNKLLPEHYAIIAGSFVAIAALTIGIKRWYEHEHAEHHSDKPSMVIHAGSAEQELPRLAQESIIARSKL